MKRKVTVFAASLVMTISALSQLEGTETKTYKDIAGVNTVCTGETQWVDEGMVLTEEQCKLLRDVRIGEYKKLVYESLNVEVQPATLTGHTIFAYNIGPNGYKRSWTLKFTNAGDAEGGCDAMKNWHSSGGKNCCTSRGPKGCRGLIVHRATAMQFCYKGLGVDFTLPEMESRICHGK